MTVTQSIRHGQDQVRQTFNTDEGRGSQLPPLAEELLAIDGHSGRESIAFRVVSPDRMLKL